jgi:hypothetical protein
MLVKRPLLSFVIYKRKTGFFPALDAAAENLDVSKPLFHIFYRPTGSTRLLRSASVEDDLLVPGHGTGFFLEGGIGSASFKMHFPELFLVVVSADEQGRAGGDSFPRFIRGNSFRFYHIRISLQCFSALLYKQYNTGGRAAIMSLIKMIRAKGRKSPPALTLRRS